MTDAPGPGRGTAADPAPEHTADTDVLAGLKLIDSDTHFSEPYDLWTSRAPAGLKNRVPRVKRGENGALGWFLEDRQIFPAGGISFVNRAGDKIPYFQRDITEHGNLWDEIHEASYDAKARVRLMDQLGVHAHVVYPNIMGFQTGILVALEDKEFAYAIVAMYNDAMAEWAAQCPGRLYPQAIMPFWDIELSVREAIRCKEELGFSGITMAGEPNAAGLPDLGQRDWDPFYEVITALRMPINIHVGSTPVAGHGARLAQPAWPSLPPRAHKPVNSVQIELANSRFVSNLVVSDVLHRWPEVKWVSVESGIGWIPYVLERVDYEYLEDYPDSPAPDAPSAFEMFRRNLYACFWFEKAGPTILLEYLGADNIMWETDFPHPTCLHPEAVRRSARALRGVGEENIRKIMQDNAAKLYNIPV
jgi:predicted TIM-barrel fold metal-dependent hydrolase